MTPNNQFPLSQDHVLVGQLLEPLFYYDIFSFPLTSSEILKFSNLPTSVELSLFDVEQVLDDLVKQQYLYKSQDYYMLHDQPDWVSSRIENSKRAHQFLKKAHGMVRLMTWFPFVRAVYISGSLSKGVMPKGGDVDYFIVTKNNRLWVCRTFLILFKKIFLLNSKKYFCVNYFVGEDFLEIEEKNRFTATEIVTLLPLYGRVKYQEFWEVNRWISSFYPHAPSCSLDEVKEQKRTIPQVILESLLNGRLGEWMDAYFMKRTLQHWNNKFEALSKEDFEIALKTKRNISKHHPQMFQQRVVKAFEERVMTFEKQHDLDLKIVN